MSNQSDYNENKPVSIEHAQKLAIQATERQKEYFWDLLHAFEHTFGCFPDEREREMLAKGAWRLFRLYG